MALFGGSSPTPAQVGAADVGAISQAQAVPQLQVGAAGQSALYQLLTSIAPGLLTGGAGTSGDIQAFLQSIGLGQAGVGGALQQQGIQTETTGVLPASAQPFFDTQLNDEIQGIKGKFASLNMSGSTAEQQAITDATNRNAASKFQAAIALGGQEFGQGASAWQQAIQSLSTGGSLASTLAQLGLGGLQLSVNDITNMASEGANLLGLSGNTYTNLATQQIAQDQQFTNTITNLFKAFGGNYGLFGTGGFLGGGGSFLSSLNLGTPFLPAGGFGQTTSG